MSNRTTNKLKLGVVTAVSAATALIIAGAAPAASAAPTDVHPMGLNGPYSTEEICNEFREQDPQFPHVGECFFTSWGPGRPWAWAYQS